MKEILLDGDQMFDTEETELIPALIEKGCVIDGTKVSYKSNAFSFTADIQDFTIA